MNIAELIATLKSQKILPIFRSSHEEIKASLELMKPLQLQTIGLTTSIPNWQPLVEELSQNFVVGLGTVKTQKDIADAIKVGAKFLVSFGAFPELISANEKLPVIPGALTPTEFLNLHRAGISIAKLYPASTVGPKYLRDLRVLLPDLNFIVTGGVGVSKEEIDIWLGAGSISIGIGSSLGNPLSDPTAFKKNVDNLHDALA